jgi:predicted component of type VI protein secretion system
MSLEAHGELTPAGGGDTIPLIRAVMTVGRRECCDVCLPFPNVSGIHCELTFRDGYWYVKDLNSTNGVKVNGARVQEKLVYPGDEISVGKRPYKIQYNMPAGRRAVEEIEEDIMSQSLLEKAGLEKPKRRRQRPRGDNFDPADFLLDDDDDDD